MKLLQCIESEIFDIVFCASDLQVVSLVLYRLSLAQPELRDHATISG